MGAENPWGKYERTAEVPETATPDRSVQFWPLRTPERRKSNSPYPQTSAEKAADDKFWASFPLFEWEEEEEAARREASQWQSVEGRWAANAPKVSTGHAYLHSHTRLQDGRESLLCDTGAVDNATGYDFVRRQSEGAVKHGCETEWTKLYKPKHLSGVGDSAPVCTHSAVVPGVLETG